jgi:EpsI family protein
MKNLRFWTAVLLLAATALVLHTRPAADQNPPRELLSMLPANIAGWDGSDQQVDQETRDVLGAGDVLARDYTQKGKPEHIGLFIVYFPSQRTGQTIHSPKNCLPGSGWVFESSSNVNLIDVNGKPHQVGEYIIADGTTKQLVVYWYQAHGRSVAGEYKAKVYMVLDAIRMNRTDGALVRVITPISSGENISDAKMRVEMFTRQLTPMLPRFIPN